VDATLASRTPIGNKTELIAALNDAAEIFNGPQRVEGEKLLGGQVDTRHPWPVSFWFGGWDGDLLIGFMKGTLSIPFRPDR
jgi:hypothetical protein